MNTASNQMEHKFPHLSLEALKQEIDATNGRVRQMQHGKAYTTESGKQTLSRLQSTLHRMRMELKRRECDAKRALHSITPSV